MPAPGEAKTQRIENNEEMVATPFEAASGPFLPTPRELLYSFSGLELLPEDIAATLCVSSEGRFFLYGQDALAFDLCARIQNRLEILSQGASLLVNLGAIRATADFVEVLVHTLFDHERLAERTKEDKRLVLTNADAGTWLALDRALQAMDASGLAITNTQQHPWHMMYLGHLESHLSVLLDDLCKHGTATPRQLSQRTSITPDDASNRLSFLYKQGLVQRERHALGRGQPTYRYQFYHPYRHIEPAFTPESIYFYQAPRLPHTTKVAGNPQADKEAEDDPYDPAALLPWYPTPLIGRNAELERIGRWLLGCQTRVITLTGAGGSGKTRLAVEAARAVARHFPGAVNFVPLEDACTAEQLPGFLVAALDVQSVPGANPLNRAVQLLGPLPSLLILDSFEYLSAAKEAEGEAVVRELLARVPNLRIVITSQTPVTVAGEQIEVQSLPLPPPESLSDWETLQNYAAVRVFVNQAKRERPDFRVTPENAEAVAALCRQVDGLALALVLAAEGVKTLSPDAILRQITSTPETLVSKRGGKGERHSSLWSTLRFSFSLLSSDQQHTLTALAVFRGGWTLSMAQAVCSLPNLEQQLPALEARAWIVREEIGGEVRYRLASVMRDFVERAYPFPESFALERRSAAYFLHFARRARQGLHSDERTQWFWWFEREYANLEGVLEWCLADATRATTAQRLAFLLSDFWFQAGLLSRGQQLLQRVLQ